MIQCNNGRRALLYSSLNLLRGLPLAANETVSSFPKVETGKSPIQSLHLFSDYCFYKIACTKQLCEEEACKRAHQNCVISTSMYGALDFQKDAQ